MGSNKWTSRKKRKTDRARQGTSSTAGPASDAPPKREKETKRGSVPPVEDPRADDSSTRDDTRTPTGADHVSKTHKMLMSAVAAAVASSEQENDVL